MSCLICERIELIQKGQNPYFVMELQTGYVVIGDYQHFYGYSLFLCKEHVTELHELPETFRLKFLLEMSVVAEAVYNVFKPEKINYELLGNADSHIHWHIFPRRKGDINGTGPVWLLPKEEMFSENVKPSKEKLQKMTSELKMEIENILATRSFDYLSV